MLLAAVGAALLVRVMKALQLGTAGLVDQATSRKLVHIISGLAFVLTWPLYSAAPSAALLAAAVPAANAARLIATGCGWMSDAQLISSVSRSGSSSELLRGPLAYVLVLLAATTLTWRQHPAGLVAVAMMCGGDGLADIGGRRWGGSCALPWNAGKSWAGSAAMLLGGLAASLGALSYFMHFGYLPQLQALGTAELLQRLAAISLACTAVESLPSHWLDDNITVSVTAATLSTLLLPGRWADSAAYLPPVWHAACAVLLKIVQALFAAQPGLVVGAAANTAVFAAGLPVLQKGLSGQGIAHAWLLGSAVFGVFGAGSYALMCIYFITGTLVTRAKLQQKQKEGIAEARAGRRGAGSVWGSGAAAVGCAALAVLTGQHALWQVGYVASLASKLADTVSSEIGKAYGTATFLVTSLKQVPRGTEGAVSVEGSLAGFMAAAGFSLCAALALQEPFAGAALLTTSAAVAANLLESYLGAALQGRYAWMTNDVVNVIQTCAAAACAVAGRQLIVAAA
uniref:Dolichol kinase n=1 Tax=Tetradesmus obliquus TaxID=3088 RepID=A0A383VCW5_TETOB|eukprot:jgi/Sobl393_1/9038/SZX62484.1